MATIGTAAKKSHCARKQFYFRVQLKKKVFKTAERTTVT